MVTKTKTYARLYVIEGPDRRWTWKLVQRNGEAVAESPQGKSWPRPGVTETSALKVCEGGGYHIAHVARDHYDPEEAP